MGKLPAQFALSITSRRILIMRNPKSGKGSTRRQEMKDKRRKRQQRQRVLIFSAIGFVALLVIALAVIPQFLPVDTVGLKRTETNFNVAGDPNAPVEIVEYSDYQCPWCQRFTEEIEPALIEEYINTGKVRLVYRSMGQWIGSESLEAAEAAYCAGDQDKFWEYHDVLFANLTGENVGAFSSARLQGFARNLKLNLSEFNACRSSDKHLERVNQDRADGDKLGVQGTPTFFINGNLYGGSFSVEGFRQVIEAALSATE
jgi:protein-disulfide isomerase